MQVESALFFETVEEIYARVFRALRPGSGLEAVEVTYRPFANANSFVRWDGTRLKVRITDVLEDAPAPIHEALAYILVSKLARRAVPRAMQQRYRLYLNRGDLRARVLRIRRERGRKQMTPAGRHYDLEALYGQLNAQYFGGSLRQPSLGWSPRPSRTLLGHYDAAHDAIVLSSLLDDATVPELVVRYVLYHEMLHQLHPAHHSGTRRCVHTREFREAEQRFAGLAEARQQLKRL